MNKIITIAFRNLRRYKRRTFLTSSLIMLGVLSVLLFTSVTGSFKNMMVGQITDAMLGHIQVHQKGFMASIDTLPLNRNLKEKQVSRLVDILENDSSVKAFSPRLKFGAMFRPSPCLRIGPPKKTTPSLKRARFSFRNSLPRG